MISQTAEYALRAVVWLAANGDRAHTNREIAAGTKVPEGYLSKVLQALARGGLVRSQRGLGGGFVLSRAAEEISVLDVINAVDPIRRIESCPLKLKSHGANLCPLHHRLDQAMAIAEEAFRDSTIRDLLTGTDRPTPLCETEAGER